MYGLTALGITIIIIIIINIIMSLLVDASGTLYVGGYDSCTLYAIVDKGSSATIKWEYSLNGYTGSRYYQHHHHQHNHYYYRYRHNHYYR
jgi:hypothetical protein